MLTEREGMERLESRVTHEKDGSTEKAESGSWDLEPGGTDLVRGSHAAALGKGRKNSWLSLWSEGLRNFMVLSGLIHV